jgi:hypothetical protein
VALLLAVAAAHGADPRMMPVDSLPVAPVTDDSFKALMARRQTPQAGIAQPPLRPIPTATMPAALAPLPGEAWFDPDRVNWVDADHANHPAAATSAGRSGGVVPGADGNRFLARIAERRAGEHAGSRLASTSQGSGRLLERLRSERRTNRAGGEDGEHRRELPGHGGELADPHAWPLPAQLVHEFEQLAARARGRAADVDAWSTATLDELDGVLQTAGPHDAGAPAALVALGDAVEAGMGLAASLADRPLAAETRRAALGLARRVAVWRATAALGAELVAAAPVTTTADTSRLLAALEGFEATRLPRDAAAAHVALAALASSPAASTPAVTRAVSDHYLAANVRIAVHHGLVSRLLPEASVSSGPLRDVILGRQVRGTRTVEQSTNVRFIPDPDRIHMELLVNGDVASRTVTESGPVTIHSRGAATFVVRKPIMVSAGGLAFGTALASASNQARLANIQTGFDSVPIMGQIVRNIARNQHDEARQEASREVNEKIIMNARREVDAQVEPRFTEMAATIRGRAWDPLVRLGLDPTPVKLETTASVASARLRLAGDGQFAAHTPRPRPPEEALLAVQFHESAVNNACERLGIAGRRLRLEEFVMLICERLGVEPRQPDDLPEGVTVTFAAEQPVRIECRDGLMHVRVALDALESGRRNWYDIIAQVAYRPVRSGVQVSLEREGPVQLSGPGHQGRMELALRTVFGKIFVKERPIAILPAKLATHPGLADVQAVQAVCADGWFALALAESAPVAATPPPTPVAEQPSRRLLRR